MIFGNTIVAPTISTNYFLVIETPGGKKGLEPIGMSGVNLPPYFVNPTATSPFFGKVVSVPLGSTNVFNLPS